MRKGGESQETIKKKQIRRKKKHESCAGVEKRKKHERRELEIPLRLDWK